QEIKEKLKFFHIPSSSNCIGLTIETDHKFLLVVYNAHENPSLLTAALIRDHINAAYDIAVREVSFMKIFDENGTVPEYEIMSEAALHGIEVPDYTMMVYEVKILKYLHV
ncbi:MAG: hypothetical protein HGA49_11185, partial [Eubacteriaceae bacterium]|nr:hypothetical protein [Eubacteriaceae bacterium]